MISHWLYFNLRAVTHMLGLDDRLCDALAVLNLSERGVMCQTEAIRENFIRTDQCCQSRMQ